MRQRAEGSFELVIRAQAEWPPVNDPQLLPLHNWMALLLKITRASGYLPHVASNDWRHPPESCHHQVTICHCLLHFLTFGTCVKRHVFLVKDSTGQNGHRAKCVFPFNYEQVQDTLQLLLNCGQLLWHYVCLSDSVLGHLPVPMLL